MWIRVYNLPFKGRLNTNIDEAIGNKIGDFIKMDSSGLMRIDKSVRIRVKFDVRKPLMKRVKIKRRGGVEEIFDVKYERPPCSIIWQRLAMDLRIMIYVMVKRIHTYFIGAG